MGDAGLWFVLEEEKGLGVKKAFLFAMVCVFACVLAGCGNENIENAAEAAVLKSDSGSFALWAGNYKSDGRGVLEQLPEGFQFSSGAGGWCTYFDLKPDGTFTGQFQDSNMGDIGDGYANGTVYICSFDGKFSVPRRIDRYIYAMSLEYLNTEGTPGMEYYEDGRRYIYAEAYGFDDADEFLVYLPGCPLERVSEGFLSWSFINAGIRETLPSGYYGIYNVGGKEGFVGMDENSLWGKRYRLDGSSRTAELRPSYYGESHLVFFSGQGDVSADLCFDWVNDEMSEFWAYDAGGSGECSISLSFREDYNSVVVSVTGLPGFDFSPWGGEDGTLSAEYVFE